MPCSIERMRKAIPFKKQPLDLQDGGISFAGFLSFANGDSAIAKQMYDQFRNAYPLVNADEEGVAQYIDWLIVNHWGEAPLASPTEAA